MKHRALARKLSILENNYTRNSYNVEYYINGIIQKFWVNQFIQSLIFVLQRTNDPQQSHKATNKLQPIIYVSTMRSVF